MYYAQINQNGICFAVTQTAGEIIAEDMIEVPSFDQDKLFRKYENGSWSTEKCEPQTTAPLTEFEAMQENLSAVNIALAEMMGV